MTESFEEAVLSRGLLLHIHGEPGNDGGEGNDERYAHDLTADVLEHTLVDVDELPVRDGTLDEVRRQCHWR